MERIRQEVTGNKVMLYMKGDRHFPQCGFSAAVVEVLEDLGCPYETRDILADPELRGAIKVFTNWPTLPQLYVGGKFVGGCDIVLEMHRAGELKPLVEQALAG
ncbi:MAG: Grx4 family monothiol glutaredoxin [Deltaproteobacteria bacterium]|nr:Grx4 family monothiol glutaredoxin [Deltaproteobacteria bacterium]